MTAHEQYRENLLLYAVGALPNEESEPLERHLAECSACSEELRALNEVAAQIAMAVDPAAPRAHLREKLISRLKDEQSALAIPVDDRHSVKGLRRRTIGFWTPVFACVILAVACALLWKRDRDVLQVNRELTAKLEASGAATQQARKLIDMLNAEDVQRITLVAAGAKAPPEAKAVYSLRQRSLILLASNLNPLPAHKTYELWLLPSSGAHPVPAGTFRPDVRGSAALVLSQFAAAVPAKGFAVTIETEPGSDVPTMPIILSGTT